LPSWADALDSQKAQRSKHYDRCSYGKRRHADASGEKVIGALSL
jgi:hypothetical protein